MNHSDFPPSRKAGRISTRRRWRPVLAGAAVLALAAGWGAGRYFDRGPDEADAARTASGPGPRTGTAASGEPPGVLHRPRPEFTLPDLDGRPRRPGEWNGKVLVVNFWATWCAPCREEIPLLIDLERRRPGVRVVGIAVDRPEAVRAFAEELGIGYPVLLDDLRGSTMRRYGNRVGALPFTVITGRDGIVAYVRLGELEPTELDRVTEALLRRESPSRA